MTTTPKADIVKQLEGSKARSNPRADGMPKKPKGMSKFASKLWDTVVPSLCRMNVVAEIDAPKLSAMCELYHDAITARHNYRQQQPGTIQAQRLWNVAISAQTAFDRQCKEFGLTPMGRAVLSVQPTTQNADDEMFFGEG